MGDLTKNFSKHEFACKCCGVSKMNILFIKRLQIAREEAQIPFAITSGYRCLKHNTAVGSQPTSSHILGLAVDLAIPNSRNRFIVLSALIEAGFTRIGIGSDFIHVDADLDKPPKVVWTY